jgi:hypothetical protein
MIVVFSKDRAFQLEACLRTLLAQCEDAADVPIRVLWTASGADHRRSYEILEKSYKGKNADILFVEESFFRRDLILILGRVRPGSWKEKIIRLLLPIKMSWAQAVISPLLNPWPTLFVVDDSLFSRPFRFSTCARYLLAAPENLAFSLRLGQGVTRSYMGNCEQEVPEMQPVDEALGIYQFRWPEGDIDFEYPLEISSSILHLHLILPRLLRKKWKSPNTLELALALMAGRYKKPQPLLLTFQEPRAVSAPLNIVQKDFTDNRHGTQERYEPAALCRLFLQGVRADLSQLGRVEQNSVHMEIDLLPAGSESGL